MDGSGLYLSALMAGVGILIAQIAWNRKLLILIGGSVDSTAAVLAAFMLGMGLGGRALGLRAERSVTPRRLLNIVIVSTAILSLAPLVLAPLLQPVYPFLYGSGLPTAMVRFLIACLMLLPATFFAGGIIPVMGRIAETGGGHGEVARLYGLNAIGSAAGGFLAGFILLELAGGSLTLLTGALACLAAAPLIGRRNDASAPIPVHAQSGRPPVLLLWVYAVSGFAALGYEVIWTRQFTFVLGNSTYAFATMGVIVLTGIGLGSLAGQRVAARVRDPRVAFGLAEIGLGLASVLPLAALGRFDDLVTAMHPGGAWVSGTAASFAAASIYMLPSTVLMGATFPLMVRAAARRERLGADTGLLSMANCLGAAAGAVLTSQVLLRVAGPTVCGTVLALVSVTAGGVVLLAASRGFLTFTVAPAAAVLVLLLSLRADQPGSTPPEGLDLLFFREGRTSTVAVFGRDWDGYRSLRINGVEEVPVDQPSLEAFYLLGHLPWGYNPDASSVLVVAMGGGITSGALLTHPIDTLICVEICPEVAWTAPLFSLENRRPDLDPRFTLVPDDGRNYLLGSRRRFDLIVCDATHPGSSDSWVLYTREFYRTMLESLAPGGVAAQWVPLHLLPAQDLRRILATWVAVFPHYGVHLAGGRHAILIGSREDLRLDCGEMFEESAAASQLASVGFSTAEPWLLEPAVSDPGLDGLIHGASSLNTDDRPLCQFIRRRAPLEPQATIAQDVSEILAAGGAGVSDLHEAQMLYWGGRLPEAVERLRSSSRGIMERRWLAVALTSAAEQMHLTGRGAEALPLLREASASDPSWPAPALLEALITGEAAP
jgi:spermidine synthase